jgi:cobalt/nickel transport system permease protein
MHMTDNLLSPALAGGMYLISGAALTYALVQIKKSDATGQALLMGALGALVFALQMVNVAIPQLGFSGHVCGAILLAALLGPWRGFLTLSCVLLIQSLLFADGGLLALGARTFLIWPFWAVLLLLCSFSSLWPKKAG